jgi:hypothetical protein
VPQSKPSEPSPFEKFAALTKKVVSVPRIEIQKRETEYKEQRKIKSHHRHR